MQPVVVDCTEARELLSAQLDQEATADEAAAANQHLGRCESCRMWWAQIGAVTRALRVRPAEVVPDLATPVLARAHPATTGRGHWVRVMLAVVASIELALALPGLFAGEGASSVHDARHLGSFGVAVAIGLLYVAWRPGRAHGILPIIVALAATMATSAVVDIINTRTTSFGEAHHMLEIAGLVLVWMLAGRPLPTRLQPLSSMRSGRAAHTIPHN